MRRIGVLLMISSLLMLLFASGCEDSQTAEETGFELATTNCIVFGIHVQIDGVPLEGMASSEQPYFYPLAAGTYRLFARSNVTLSMSEPDPLCWTREITISDGNVTTVILDCEDTVECNE